MPRLASRAPWHVMSVSSSNELVNSLPGGLPFPGLQNSTYGVNDIEGCK